MSRTRASIATLDCTLLMRRHCGLSGISLLELAKVSLHIRVDTHPILCIVARTCFYAENGPTAVPPQKHACVQTLNVHAAGVEMPPEYFTANSVMLAQIAHAASPDRFWASLQLLQTTN